MTHQFRFTVDNTQEVTDALREIFLTPTGVEYKETCYTSERGNEDLQKILTAAELVAGGPNITVQNMETALRLLIDSGELAPRELAQTPELAEPEPDTRPRTKDGKLLTPAQIKWSEYRQFAETASMREINDRKRVDAGFANFVRKNLEREMTHEIDGAGTVMGESTLPKHDASNELVAFARAYMVESTVNLKPRNGMVSVGGQPMTWPRFQELLAKATQARLV